jgi:cation diffusion facilitator CzcD-associated flavoprotein CzcO
VIPRNDRAYTDAEKQRFRRFPWLTRLHRALIYSMLEARFFGFFRGSWMGKRLEKAATEYLHSQIQDPKLRALLTPDYPVGCKRILISDDYYQALTRPNVEVVGSHIERIVRDGIVTADGVTRPVDTIIFGTGFETTSFLAPMQIEGLGGRKLEEGWRDGAEAYLGVGVSGFPNLFLLYGPNTNLGHNSIIFMIECQVRYVLQCIQALARNGAAQLDVRPEAMERYNERLQRDIQKTAWAAGCHSWYKTESGKITNNWSGFTVEYWWRTRRPDLRDFQVVPRSA